MAHQNGNGVPLGVLVIGRKRPGFDQDWNLIQRRKCVAAMEAAGHRCVGADDPVVDDQTIGQRIARSRPPAATPSSSSSPPWATASSP